MHHISSISRPQRSLSTKKNPTMLTRRTNLNKSSHKHLQRPQIPPPRKKGSGGNKLSHLTCLVAVASSRPSVGRATLKQQAESRQIQPAQEGSRAGVGGAASSVPIRGPATGRWEVRGGSGAAGWAAAEQQDGRRAVGGGRAAA